MPNLSGFTATIVVILALFCWMGWVHRTTNRRLFHDRNRDVNAIQTGLSVFTVIGAPHFTFITIFAYFFGWWCFALYVGSFAGFLVMTAFAPKIRRSAQSDAHSYAELAAERGVFEASTLAVIGALFSFSALVTQIFTGGHILSELDPTISENLANILVTIAVVGYLFWGGYRALLFTDLVQGTISLALALSLVFFIVGSWGHSGYAGIELLPNVMFPQTMVMLFVAGFFIELGAPVNWQRILTANSDRSAQWGMFFGGCLVLLGGALISVLAIAIATQFPTVNPSGAFIYVVANEFPLVVAGMAVAVLLLTLMSTADSALFVASVMLYRAGALIRSWSSSATEQTIKFAEMEISTTRAIIVMLGFLSMMVSLFVSNIQEAFGLILNIGFITGPLAFGIVLKRGGRTSTQRRILYLICLGLATGAFGFISVFVGDFLTYWSFFLIAPACIPLFFRGEERQQTQEP